MLLYQALLGRLDHGRPVLFGKSLREPYVQIDFVRHPTLAVAFNSLDQPYSF